MAPGGHARRVGQRLLEEEPPVEAPAPEPPEAPSAPPPPPVPGEPTVPPEGSAAALQLRQRAWLVERDRRDAAASAGPPAAPPAEPSDPGPRNG